MDATTAATTARRACLIRTSVLRSSGQLDFACPPTAVDLLHRHLDPAAVDARIGNVGVRHRLVDEQQHDHLVLGRGLDRRLHDDPVRGALLSISSWRSWTLAFEYMSLNSPVAPSSTWLKFSSTLFESMLVRTSAYATAACLGLLAGAGHLVLLPQHPAQNARDRQVRQRRSSGDRADEHAAPARDRGLARPRGVGVTHRSSVVVGLGRSTVDQASIRLTAVFSSGVVSSAGSAFLSVVTVMLISSKRRVGRSAWWLDRQDRAAVRRGNREPALRGRVGGSPRSAPGGGPAVSSPAGRGAFLAPRTSTPGWSSRQ